MHHRAFVKGSRSIQEWFSHVRRQRRVKNQITFALVLLGPFLAFFTFLAVGSLNQGMSSPLLQLIFLADLIYVLVVAALVLGRIVRLISDRKSQSAGSLLHLRLSAVFAFVALVPTVLVAIFAVLTVNIGIEGWFSERVRSVVGASLAAAQSYEEQVSNDLIADAVALAEYIDDFKKNTPFLREDRLRPLLSQAQEVVQRGLKEAFLIDGSGELRTRGERSYLFDYEIPTSAELKDAQSETVILVEDWPNNELRALVQLKSFSDRYLYVSREVDGQLLSLLDETRETVRLYNQLENDRGRILFNFGLIYLGFAIILILAAVWLGMWFAETLARPVGRLAEAALKVGEGNLDVQVKQESSDDEIAILGRLFNKMTQQLKGQRDALVYTHALTEGRRRLFDSVLSNITSGVIGLASDGRIDFVNKSAMNVLDVENFHTKDELYLKQLVPEFLDLFAQVQKSGTPVMQAEIFLVRKEKQENLLVRISVRLNDAKHLEGYVISFDDVTELVSAQRMAAWGDVARRIAHEIKNPLTPIALSAERIRRKFASQVSEPQDLEQYANVIVRQTNDLRRIVDEFSKFARMPEPELHEVDLCQLVSDVVTLQESGQPDVVFIKKIPEHKVILPLDATMISQALTNIIKNAGEAIEVRRDKYQDVIFTPCIGVELDVNERGACIRVIDNGIGLPAQRTRLFEPYVTTRNKGTGLGLSIVKKIIEEHGGALALSDVPDIGENNNTVEFLSEIKSKFDLLQKEDTGHLLYFDEVWRGAMVEIHFPYSPSKQNNVEQNSAG